VVAEDAAGAEAELVGFTAAAGAGPELEHATTATPAHKTIVASNTSRGFPLVGPFILLSLCSGMRGDRWRAAEPPVGAALYYET